ncbi:hypothetical protein BC831DRAFT_188953 [Entophlyctis helioformis]|nr:hypothetical protein BC831DRAFT_188953 [Entophlyctis helioformis]
MYSVFTMCVYVYTDACGGGIDYAPPAGDPFAWTEANEMEARLIQPLLTESDNRIMRSHTNELVQRARLASSMVRRMPCMRGRGSGADMGPQRRKQDFSKWMRTKMKFFQKMGAGEIASIGFVSEDQRL